MARVYFTMYVTHTSILVCVRYAGFWLLWEASSSPSKLPATYEMEMQFCFVQGLNTKTLIITPVVLLLHSESSLSDGHESLTKSLGMETSATQANQILAVKGSDCRVLYVKCSYLKTSELQRNSLIILLL